MARTGLWTSPSSFKEFSGDKEGLLSEIATYQRRSDFWSITQFLPNPDPVLKKQGKDITAYQELLTDAHLGGCVDTYKGNIQALEWDIDRGKAKSRQAKVVKAAFERLDVERIIDEILDAPFFGYQPMEILWEERDGVIAPRDVVGKPQEWFHFDVERQLRLRTLNDYNGEVMDDTQVFAVKHQPRYTNQYGFPILSRCFWPVIFKKGGVKFWVTFAEKYGMPWVTAKYPDGWVGNQKLIDKYFDDVSSMVQDALIALPQGADVNVTATGGTASAEIFKGIKDWANEEMSKAVFGHGAAADSTAGKLGNEDSAIASVDAKKSAAKKLVMSAFNHVIRKMTAINFGDNVVAPKFILFEEEDVDLKLAERDGTLYGMGWRPTSQYVQREFGFEDGDFTLEHEKPTDDEDEQQPPQPPPAEFAEADPRGADQKAVDAMLDDLDLAKISSEFVEVIAEEVKKYSSFEEAREKVLSIYPKLKGDRLRESLFKSMFNAALAGALAVDNEEVDE